MILRLLPFCAALLSACASLPPPTAAVPAPAISGPSFSLEGRLSVRQGEISHHVGINWRHDAASDEIFLTGPLGQGLARLTRDAAGARLLTADRQVLEAADWESLAERALGAHLPLSNLPRWLATVPHSGQFIPLPPTANLDGWRIDVLEVVAGRPTLIDLHRDGIEARLRIDQWTK